MAHIDVDSEPGGAPRDLMGIDFERLNLADRHALHGSLRITSNIQNTCAYIRDIGFQKSLIFRS